MRKPEIRISFSSLEELKAKYEENISAGVIFIETDEQVIFGEERDILLSLPDNPRVMSFKGQVINILEDVSGVSFKVGFQLLDLNEEKKRILKNLWESQAQKKEKSVAKPEIKEEKKVLPYKQSLPSIPEAGGEKFTSSLIKALIKTGYYVPGHPEYDRAREGLYHILRTTIKDKPEITYIARIAGEHTEILVDGLKEERVTLRQLLSRGSYESFFFKFLEYFQRKNLVCFSIKKDISQREFDKFIEIMSRGSLGGDPIKEGEKLHQEILANKIFNVSVIFAEDLIGKKRRLPWQVDLCLSRLTRDLKVLPFLSKASVETLRQIRLQLISDIIRPILYPETIKSVLLHCDLIEAEIKGIKEMEEISIQEAIISILNEKMLISTCEALVNDLDSRDLETDKELVSKKVKIQELIKILASRLLKRYKKEADNLLRKLYKKRIISFEDLPQNLKEWIQAESLIETLSENPTHINAFDLISDPEIYEKETRIIIKSAQLLVARNQYPLLLSLLSLMAKHRDSPEAPFLNRDKIAAERLSSFWTKENLECIWSAFKQAEPKIKESIKKIYPLGKEKTSSFLIDLLKRELEPELRQDIEEMIIKIGRVKEDKIKEELRKVQDSAFLKSIIYILRYVGNRESVGSIVRYLGIQDPGVRKEALNTIATLLGKSSEHYLLRLLGDKDPSIRVQALFHLVKIESNHSKFLDFLFKVLDRGVNLLSEAELIRILNAIREMKEIPRKQELESRVIRLLEGRTKGGLMGFIKRRKPLGSSSLLQAAGKLLIKIQSSYPEHILKESGSEKEDPKRLKIRKIFKELVLEERTN